MVARRQLIEDMFQEEPDLPSLPREDISLNFTNSSRSSKQKKSPHPQALPPGEIAALAQTHLDKVTRQARSSRRGWRSRRRRCGSTASAP